MPRRRDNKQGKLERQLASLKNQMRVENRLIKRSGREIIPPPEQLTFRAKRWVRARVARPASGKWYIQLADLETATGISAAETDCMFFIERIRVFTPTLVASQPVLPLVPVVNPGSTRLTIGVFAGPGASPTGPKERYTAQGEEGAKAAIIEIEFGRHWRESVFGFAGTAYFAEIITASQGTSSIGTLIVDFLADFELTFAAGTGLDLEFL